MAKTINAELTSDATGHSIEIVKGRVIVRLSFNGGSRAVEKTFVRADLTPTQAAKVDAFEALAVAAAESLTTKADFE